MRNGISLVVRLLCRNPCSSPYCGPGPQLTGPQSGCTRPMHLPCCTLLTVSRSCQGPASQDCTSDDGQSYVRIVRGDMYTQSWRVTADTVAIRSCLVGPLTAEVHQSSFDATACVRPPPSQSRQTALTLLVSNRFCKERAYCRRIARCSAVDECEWLDLILHCV